jgi:hypothetical protein
MQAHDRGLARRGFHGKDIKTERGLSRAVFEQELPRHSGEMSLLVLSDGVLGRTHIVARRSPRLHLDECKRGAIVSNQVDFAFDAAGGKVSRDHDVTVSAEIPVCVRLTANSGAPGLVSCGRGRRRRGRIREAFSCGPIHPPEHCASQNRHGPFLYSNLSECKPGLYFLSRFSL